MKAMATHREEQNKNISRFVSLLIHALLLCFCIYYTITYLDPPPPPPNAVYVEFQQEVVASAASSSPAETKVTQKEEAAAPKAPSESVAQSSITEDKAPIVSSKSKPKEEIKQKKVTTDIPEQPKVSQEEIDARNAEEARKKLESSKSKFGSLLSKSGDGNTSSSNTSTQDGELDVLTEGVSQIGKGLTGRNVIKKPTIRDRSQKTGKVAVTICIDQSGRVMTAKYTQSGSTTTDDYLVDLAEKAARQYQFEASDTEKQCGDIIIDFKVK